MKTSKSFSTDVNGVVLVGGADLDTRRDGWNAPPTIRPLAPAA